MKVSIALLCCWAIVSFAGPRIAHAVEVGDPAPDLNLPVISGELEAEDANTVSARPAGIFPLLTLSDYRGRVVYLDFWDASCAPCRESLPAMSELRDAYPRADFEVIAINLDSDPRQALRFLAAHPVSFPVVSDPSATSAETYQLDGLPTAFLISPDGLVESVHRGFAKQDIITVKNKLTAMIAGR